MTQLEAMATDLATYALKGTNADDMDINELAEALIERCKDAVAAMKEGDS